MNSKEKLVNLKIKNEQGKEFIISRFNEKSNFSNLIKNLVENVETSFYFISEIKGNLDLENEGSSRKIIKDLIDGKRKPQNENEKKAINIHAALSYIDLVKPNINKENIMLIYNMVIQDIIMDDDTLESNYDYRQSQDDGYVNTFKTPSQNVLREGMRKLIEFINSKDLNEFPIEKCLIIQIIFIYFHPFYDFNGRIGRIMTYWFLTLHGHNEMKNIIYLSLPNFKDKYIKFWEELRKFKWYDLTTFMNFLGNVTLVSASKILAIKQIANLKGTMFNDSETLILFNLLDYQDWINGSQFIKKIDLGISKQGLYKSMNSLDAQEIIKKKLQKNQLFIKSNFSTNNFKHELISKFFKYYWDNRGKQNITGSDIK